MHKITKRRSCWGKHLKKSWPEIPLHSQTHHCIGASQSETESAHRNTRCYTNRIPFAPDRRATVNRERSAKSFHKPKTLHGCFHTFFFFLSLALSIRFIILSNRMKSGLITLEIRRLFVFTVTLQEENQDKLIRLCPNLLIFTHSVFNSFTRTFFFFLNLWKLDCGGEKKKITSSISGF